LLSIFGQKHPHVRVCATVTDSMSVMAQVERGEVSLGLLVKRPRILTWGSAISPVTRWC
jgi:hypothetical protein